MNRKTHITVRTLATILICSVGAAVAGDFELGWYTIDGGGGESTGGDYSLQGTVGQPDSGVLAGGTFELHGGFWQLHPPPCPEDLDGDGIVKAEDLAIVLGSWGPNLSHPADFNGDGVIEAADLATLLGSWGPCS